MKKNNNKTEILVYADWVELNSNQLMGILTSEFIRGNEVFSFEYSKQWLNNKNAQILDPDLFLYSGKQFLSDEKLNFGLFLDSSPDRWGRLLMTRREAAYARIENRPEKKLVETDFLLGVYDQYRMGALRFKRSENSEFLNNDKLLAAPPWISLRTLEEISLNLEDDNAIDNPEYIKWLNMLVNPGSSLGGARPKASIIDKNGHLWIAKFPSKFDDINIGGWEIIANELAKEAGLNVAYGIAQKFSNNNYTYLTKRFDRFENGTRLHFASAMTLLGYNDGNDYKNGVSYLELAEFIIKNGAKPTYDLEELWKRIVFYILISNTDDHLRNHGFILSNSGWILSPAFDINPIPNSTGLKLNISETDNSLNINLALSVKQYFRISDIKANQIIKSISETVKNWRIIAKKYNVSRDEQERMKSAFNNI